jgi:hypothetical protein
VARRDEKIPQSLRITDAVEETLKKEEKEEEEECSKRKEE